MFDFLFGKKPRIEDLSAFEGEYSSKLNEFRGNHKLQKGRVNNIDMSWYDSGTDGSALVLLPGTTGNGEVWYLYFMALKEQFRVIVPDFPMSQSMDVLSKTLSEWLMQLQVDSAILVGQSFGGVVAQHFSDTYPEQVRKLVLITSFSNTQTVTDKTRRNYEKSLKRFLGALKDLKFESFQKTIYKQVIKGVDVAFVEDKPFWKAYYGNLLLESSQDLLKTMHEVQIDFWANVLEEPAVNKGPVMLIEAKTDASYDREEKKALLNRYPGAQKVEIEGSSNMSHIREIDQIVKSIASF